MMSHKLRLVLLQLQFDQMNTLNEFLVLKTKKREKVRRNQQCIDVRVKMQQRKRTKRSRTVWIRQWFNDVQRANDENLKEKPQYL